MQKVKLGDICEKGSSNIAQKDVENNSGNYPIYGAAGLIKYVDFYQQEKEYIAVVKDGAGIGRAMKLPAKSSVIGTMQYIFPKENVYIDYLFYLLSHLNLAKYFSGATIPHIYFKDYKNEEVNLPPLEEQKAIAEKLDKVSILIEKRKQQLSLLDTLVKSKFVEMFGEQNYKKIKISEICEFITKGTTPPFGQIQQKFEKDSIPYLKVYNLSFTGELLFSKQPQYISKQVHNEILSRSKVYPNDVLMNIVGPPLGKFALVTNEYPEWNINQAISIFRAKKMVSSRYLMTALMQPDVLNPFLQQAVGIRQLNISLEQCRNLEIPLPPIEEQNQFADFAEKTEKTKAKIKQSLAALELLKKSLMQKYFG